MNITILQLPQPWAWTVVAGLRYTHGVPSPLRIGDSSIPSKAQSAGACGPAAVIATTTNLGLGQATRFLRENGIAVPMKRDMPQGAFLGLVDISKTVRRTEIPDYLLLDDHPWQMVLVRPFQLPVPERRPYFNFRAGFPVSEVLRALAGRRDECSRSYVEQLREMELSS